MPTPLAELARLFLRLGATAFGGPAVHVAMMEDEVVRRRGWLARDEFLDLVGAANLIPGPNSTELAIHIGYRRAGWAGLVVAGVCFIVPAMVIVSAIAWAYVRWGRLPAMEGILLGVKPVVIAVVLQALWGLGRTAVRGWWLALLAVACVAAATAGAHELLVLLGAGIIAAVVGAARRGAAQARSVALVTGAPGAWPGAAAFGATTAAGGAMATFGLLPLFLFFLKVGAVLYGSGYVLLAFLRADLVGRFGWLTEAQLLDAVAVGQVTPGPVFTTATFIGWLLAGAPGAAVATLGIFLPAFVFVAISGPLVPRIRRSPVAGAVLDGVNVASLALMAVVTVELGRSALVDVATLLLALASFALLVHWRVNSAWLVLGGAMVGLVMYAA